MEGDSSISLVILFSGCKDSCAEMVVVYLRIQIRDPHYFTLPNAGGR